jgi:dimethylamine monooxygenase subunit A
MAAGPDTHTAGLVSRWTGRLQPARYFPVHPGPLKMTPGLFRLGTDFGNGAADARHFQGDEYWPRYQDAKRTVLKTAPDRVCAATSAQVTSIHGEISAWMTQTINSELDLALAPEQDYLALTEQIQEDFVVVHAPPGEVDCVIAVSVCFPSGWRPETLLGQSFATVHAPVPAFDTVRNAGPALVRTMVEQGPFVRFVWTVCADARLDHHPEGDQRAVFTGGHGYLRVERQVTVPFPIYSASLFLIRTYLYPFATLSTDKRRILANALSSMPAAIAAYKGLTDQIPSAVALLTQGPHE